MPEHLDATGKKVYKALCGNHLTAELALFLAVLDQRVRLLEAAGEGVNDGE